MGWGDEIMATAHARVLHAKTGAKVRIVDRIGRQRWNEAWLHNPKILQMNEGWAGPLIDHTNGGKARPHVKIEPGRFIFTPNLLPGPGEIYFSRAELDYIERIRSIVAPHVIIAPEIKPSAPVNKSWGFERFQALAQRLGDVPLLQIGTVSARRLPHPVAFLETPTLRHAAAVISVARAFVSNEGGIHHTAAALGIKGVVIFGGFISPSVTGYASHRNIYIESKEHPNGCGFRHGCDHCKASMAAITVDRVEAELRSILNPS